jgi:hypothetical protein
MTGATAFDGCIIFDGRTSARGRCRRVFRFLLIGGGAALAAAAAAGALILLIAVTTVRVIHPALAVSFHLSPDSQQLRGPASLALAVHDHVLPGSRSAKIEVASAEPETQCAPDFARSPLFVRRAGMLFGGPCPDGAADVTGSVQASANPADLPSFEAIWTRTTGLLAAPPLAAPPVRPAPQVPLEPARNTPGPPSPIQPAGPQLASATEKRVTLPQAHVTSVLLPDPDSRTAVYDIAAHTVYLPNGTKLEAHSGLGRKLDDPRYVSVKDRGPTPPNVYELTLREQLFHEVRALRLTPVGGESMFGRDGILAHTYMLGPNGESNGCVSFKDYQAFLRAYLRGEVERLVVVPHLDDASLRVASARRGSAGRYPDNIP